MRRTAPHLVEVRPWPILVGMVRMSIVVRLIFFFRGEGRIVLSLVSFGVLVIILGQW